MPCDRAACVDGVPTWLDVETMQPRYSLRLSMAVGRFPPNFIYKVIIPLQCSVDWSDLALSVRIGILGSCPSLHCRFVAQPCFLHLAYQFAA